MAELDSPGSHYFDMNKITSNVYKCVNDEEVQSNSETLVECLISDKENFNEDAIKEKKEEKISIINENETFCKKDNDLNDKNTDEKSDNKELSLLNIDLKLDLLDQKKKKLHDIKNQCSELISELNSNEDPEIIVKKHIDQLHVYNELKSKALVLLTMLADQRQLRVVDILKEMNFDLNDD